MNELEKIELLKKYKELLDLGIISAEEFEKKKELLLNDAEDESKQTEEPVAEDAE